jgi:hypothetical protein
MVRVSLPARMEKIVSSCSGRKEVYPQCFFKMALSFSLTGFRKILLYALKAAAEGDLRKIKGWAAKARAVHGEKYGLRRCEPARKRSGC